MQTHNIQQFVIVEILQANSFNAPCKMDKETVGERETQGRKRGGRKEKMVEEEGSDARAGFKVALTQDISLSDSGDRRGARLCLP